VLASGKSLAHGSGEAMLAEATRGVISARKGATMTLQLLLSTVFDPANHLSQR
jgi:hypothetical protein